MSIIDLLAALLSRSKPSCQPSPPTCEAWLLEAAGKSERADDLNMYMDHWNGYVREAATKRAAERLEPGTLRTIIDRLNDWVPQVRMAARTAITAFVQADRFEDVLQAWPAIRRLRDRSREDHQELVAILETWLAHHPRRPRLIDLVRGTDPVFVRAMYALELRNPSADRRALIEWGLRCGDIITSKLACSLIGSLDDRAQLEMAMRLLASRRGYLRLAGLNYLSALDPEKTREAAQQFLLSPYAPLQRRSEQLVQISHDDWAVLVREALTDASAHPSRRMVAVTLSGKKAFADCQSELAVLLDGSDRALRAAALLALFRLAPETYEARVRKALTDRDPRIVRSALQAVEEGDLILEPSEWQAAISALSSLSLAHQAMRVARSQGKWTWLAIALELAGHPTYGSVGVAAIGNWLSRVNRSFQLPSAAHRLWIGGLIDTYHDARTAKLLRFHLG